MSSNSCYPIGLQGISGIQGIKAPVVSQINQQDVDIFCRSLVSYTKYPLKVTSILNRKSFPAISSATTAARSLLLSIHFKQAERIKQLLNDDSYLQSNLAVLILNGHANLAAPLFDRLISHRCDFLQYVRDWNTYTILPSVYKMRYENYSISLLRFWLNSEDYIKFEQLLVELVDINADIFCNCYSLTPNTQQLIDKLELINESRLLETVTSDKYGKKSILYLLFHTQPGRFIRMLKKKTISFSSLSTLYPRKPLLYLFVVFHKSYTLDLAECFPTYYFETADKYGYTPIFYLDSYKDSVKMRSAVEYFRSVLTPDLRKRIKKY